jgi:hypothetical protein
MVASTTIEVPTKTYYSVDASLAIATGTKSIIQFPAIFLQFNLAQASNTVYSAAHGCRLHELLSSRDDAHVWAGAGRTMNCCS